MLHCFQILDLQTQTQTPKQNIPSFLNRELECEPRLIFQRMGECSCSEATPGASWGSAIRTRPRGRAASSGWSPIGPCSWLVDARTLSLSQVRTIQHLLVFWSKALHLLEALCSKIKCSDRNKADRRYLNRLCWSSSNYGIVYRLFCRCCLVLWKQFREKRGGRVNLE